MSSNIYERERCCCVRCYVSRKETFESALTISAEADCVPNFVLRFGINKSSVNLFVELCTRHLLDRQGYMATLRDIEATSVKFFERIFESVRFFKDGFHGKHFGLGGIQKRVNDLHGTVCLFCTVGAFLCNRKPWSLSRPCDSRANERLSRTRIAFLNRQSNVFVRVTCLSLTGKAKKQFLFCFIVCTTGITHSGLNLPDDLRQSKNRNRSMKSFRTTDGVFFSI